MSTAVVMERPARAPAPARRGDRAVLAGAFALALVLRVPFARIPSGPDEGGLSFIARAWGHGHGSLYGAYWVDRPPLLLALFRLGIQGGPLGVRAIGAAAALALVALTFHIARAVAGPRAGRIAAVLCAVLTGSAALTAAFTPAELLASVPAAASVGALLAAHRRGTLGPLAAAGLLAVGAALIKQSFLDAGLAGIVFLAAGARRDLRGAARRAGAYAGGGLVALAPVAVWQVAAHVPAGALPYALFGFRIDALRILSGANLPLHVRLGHLQRPALDSGLLFAVPAAVWGLRALRHDRIVASTLAAWLFGAAGGVLGGGSYWSHYLLQLVGPVVILAGTALAGARPWARWAQVTAVVATAVAMTGSVAVRFHAHPPHRPELAIARYVRARARPGDTQYVLYARANLDYLIGLPSPYPYAWSLLDRAIPGAPGRLARLLGSSRRPTWVVVWQRPREWGLDRHHAIRRDLHSRYRRVATVGGHAIYHAERPSR